jgi:hypothetical protein
MAKIISRSRWKFLLLLVFLILYICGYVVVRVNKLLIHRATYRTTLEKSRITYYHSVSTADFGIPIFPSYGIWNVAGFCFYLYTPLRIGESIFWYLYPKEYEFRGY